MHLTSWLMGKKEPSRPKPRPRYKCLAKVPVPVFQHPGKFNVDDAPALLSTMVNTSKIMGAIVCPADEGCCPRLAVVLEDRSIVLYDADTLCEVNTVYSCSTHAICPVRPSTVIMGHLGGTLTMMNLETSEMCCEFKAHTDDVNCLDAWQGYIVSAGRDHILRAYRISGNSLAPIASVHLASMATSIKLVKLANQVCVAAVGHKSTALDFYAIKKHSLKLQKTVNLIHDDQYPIRLRDPVMELDDSRSHYFITISCPRSTRVITGEVNGSSIASHCDLDDWHSWKEDCQMPKLVWSCSANCMLLVEDDHVIKGINALGKVLVEFTEFYTKNARSFASCSIGGKEFFFMEVIW